jgi:hypothetical protein
MSTTATSSNASTAFTAFVLGQIRITKLRFELAANQADMAIAALSNGLITPEMAVLVLAETGLEISLLSNGADND